MSIGSQSACSAFLNLNAIRTAVGGTAKMARDERNPLLDRVTA
jgi:hypothetical protein